jgi:excisionase family DNA binding protein
MTSRTFRPSQSQASNQAVYITTTGTRARSLTKLRTIDETAELLNTSSRTVRRFIDSGALAAHRLGRSVRISEADIATFLAANRSV